MPAGGDKWDDNLVEVSYDSKYGITMSEVKKEDVLKGTDPGVREWWDKMIADQYQKKQI